PVRERLRLELEVEDVVPLREIELLVRVQVLPERAKLLGGVAVHLELAVEERERGRLRRRQGERHRAEPTTSPHPHAGPPIRAGTEGRRATAPPRTRILAASRPDAQSKKAATRRVRHLRRRRNGPRRSCTRRGPSVAPRRSRRRRAGRATRARAASRPRCGG